MEGVRVWPRYESWHGYDVHTSTAGAAGPSDHTAASSIGHGSSGPPRADHWMTLWHRTLVVSDRRVRALPNTLKVWSGAEGLGSWTFSCICWTAQTSMVVQPGATTEKVRFTPDWDCTMKNWANESAPTTACRPGPLTW